MYCIYRYIDKDTKKILYVGKTDSSLENRINQHQTETKFKDIDAEIEYVELKNNMETRFYEFYFINKWKPVLNIADKYEYDLDCEISSEFEWKKYVSERNNKSSLSKEEKIKFAYERIKQGIIEENAYFDGKHIHMNNFSEDEAEIFIFICKQYLLSSDNIVIFEVGKNEFKIIKLMLDNIQSKVLKCINEACDYQGYKYIEHVQYLLDEKCIITVHMNPSLKYEWIEDLVAKYIAG